jgi:1-acyl-sn-glycerol-3-phosphate acyltransferase
LLLAPLVKALSSEIKNFSEFEVIFVFMELPSIYNKILQSINTVTIKRDSPNQYMVMKDEIQKRISMANSNNKKPIVIIFPEGGTSGKSNSGGAYSLLAFKNGYRRLAEDFKFDILPIAILVDSDINYYAHFGHFLSSYGDVITDRNDFISLLASKNVY